MKVLAWEYNARQTYELNAAREDLGRRKDG